MASGLFGGTTLPTVGVGSQWEIPVVSVTTHGINCPEKLDPFGNALMLGLAPQRVGHIAEAPNAERRAGNHQVVVWQRSHGGDQQIEALERMKSADRQHDGLSMGAMRIVERGAGLSSAAP